MSALAILSACAAGIVLGNGIGRWLDDTVFLALAASIAVALLFVRSRQGRLFFCLVIALLIGLLRTNQAMAPLSAPTVADFAGREIAFTGTVAEEAVERTASQELVLRSLHVGDQDVSGRLLLRLPRHPVVAYGDEVVFRCKPKIPEPIEGFPYDRVLRSRGIFATCSYPQAVDIRPNEHPGPLTYLLRAKTVLVHQLSLLFPEPHAGFISGLLFGGNHGLPSDLRGDFSRTGVSHVMAASGYNVAIFSQLLLLYLMRSPLGRRRALVASALFVVVYVLLAGATAAVVRAGIMALLCMLALWLGRPQSMRNVLLLTADLMLLANPLLLQDVGFQLSFGATVGLVLLADHFEGWLAFLPEGFGVRSSFAATCAAMLVTTPVLLWHFGTFSLAAPFVNLLILPWIPYAMFFAGLALLLSFFLFPLAALAALPAWGLSSLMLHVVRWFGSLGFASVDVPVAHFLALLSAVLIFLLICLLRHQERDRASAA